MTSAMRAHEIARPLAYCNWQIGDTAHTQRVGVYEVRRHWLVPSEGCVLSLSIRDPGESAVVSGVSWTVFWMELPAGFEAGSEFMPQARSHRFWVHGRPEKSDLKALARVEVLEISENAISAALELDYEGARLAVSLSFPLEEPFSEDTHKAVEADQRE